MRPGDNPSTKNIDVIVAEAADGEFLYTVYAATRLAEVAGFGWDPPQIEAFLKMQFSMRTRSYALQFPAAITYVIHFGGKRAGNMIVDRIAGRIFLIDIAILHEYRGRGIATYLIRMLQDEASASARCLDLTVDKGNVYAFRLYTSLGFTVTGETDLNY